MFTSPVQLFLSLLNTIPVS